MMHIIIKRRSVFFMAACGLILVTILFACGHELALVAAERQQDQSPTGTGSASTSTPRSSGLASYLSSARNLLSNGLEAHESAPQTYSNLRPNDDTRTDRMLRETIDKTSVLIDDYQHEGLASMPALPNLPGLNSLMRLPDKLLRAELVMLQDGIRMAQEMRARPITATMNTPRELASMFLKMTAQLNQ